jgi:hypothetical protein
MFRHIAKLPVIDKAHLWAMEYMANGRLIMLNLAVLISQG